MHLILYKIPLKKLSWLCIDISYIHSLEICFRHTREAYLDLVHHIREIIPGKYGRNSSTKLNISSGFCLPLMDPVHINSYYILIL